MLDIYKEIINLVKAAVHGDIYSKTVSKDHFKILQENGLAGTVFLALNKEMLDSNVYNLFQQEYYMYIKKDQRQLNVIEELREIFIEENIDFILLKGSYLKSIYPESYMRSMGDIDCLIKPESMEKVHKVLAKHGYKNWVISTNHDCFMKYKDINVEIHPKLDSEFTHGYENLLSDPWKNALRVSKNEYQFIPEFNFLYLVYHMVKHLYSSGVGYRSIVDLYLMLKKHNDLLKTQDFMKFLAIFKHKDFLNFIIEYLNSNLTDVLLSLPYHYDNIKNIYIDDFTSFIMVSGIHGIGENHNLFSAGIAKESGKSKSIFLAKIRFLFSRVFLSKKQMVGIYPFVGKCGLLLPLAWMMRALRLIFLKRKNTIRKMKRFSIRGEEVHKVENLFNNIGL